MFYTIDNFMPTSNKAYYNFLNNVDYALIASICVVYTIHIERDETKDRMNKIIIIIDIVFIIINVLLNKYKNDKF